MINHHSLSPPSLSIPPSSLYLALSLLSPLLWPRSPFFRKNGVLLQGRVPFSIALSFLCVCISLSLSLFLCPLSPSLLSLPLTNNTRGLQRGRVREGTFFVTRTSGKSVLDTKSPRESPPSKEVKVCPIQLSLSNRLCLRGKEHHF